MKLLKKLASLLVESYAPDAAREATLNELLRSNLELRERMCKVESGCSARTMELTEKLVDAKLAEAALRYQLEEAEMMRDAHGMELDRIKRSRTVILSAPHDPVSLEQARLAIALDAAKGHVITPEEHEAQRQSWARQDRD